MNAITLYYFHDPMCSWCWGFSQALSELRRGLPETIQFKRVLGGLAADNSEIMPQQLQTQIQSGWARIEALVPGVKFNFDYWTLCQPRRSTYASCRAVIAARVICPPELSAEYDEKMTKAIQAAYYQQARNPSLDETLIEIAAEIGLERQAFAEALNSEQVNQTLAKEIEFSRSLDVNSFPSLVLMIGEEDIPIGLDYVDAGKMLNMIAKVVAQHSVPN